MKRLIAIVLAVVLLAGGFSGFAYAKNNSDEAMTGQKLVGFGGLGRPPDGSTLLTAYAIMNPDCVAEITIERMSILRSDGTLIYEGPLLRRIGPPTGGEIEECTRPMKPHEVWIIDLSYSIPDGNGGFLTKEQAMVLDYDQYTVEVFWSGSKKGCPLTGWICYYQGRWIDGQLAMKGWGYEMVNVNQKLK